MKGILVKVLKILWILCSLAVLAITLVYTEPNQSNDVYIVFMYGMLSLSFPIGILVAWLFALLILLEEYSGVPLLSLLESNYVVFSVMWVVFFAAGYAQWFIFLPLLWNKIKMKIKARRMGSSGA
ncbi:hypothetical protein [Desulfovibrio litoralis]|nr:hypothetical protein [Desulfovibrio litoralis]